MANCSCCAGSDLCCNRKLTWPIFISTFHIIIYASVIIFNGYNLVLAIIALSNGETTTNHKGTILWDEDDNLGLGLLIAHTICILVLALVGLVISFNLLKASKQELARNLKIWLVYTVLFCVLIVPYYVWRLSTSQHVGRWLIQLVATNAIEGYFLGIAYSIITELHAASSKSVERESSRFRGKRFAGGYIPALDTERN
ncbi:unnamed protein product [Allacma fusca]|uniref:Transmembrane protein n=1 Tax=Allacma fusca TaxID=39272 RepID=A0A8J2PJ57_9HEXA|nr:unnamed protein product [Allacma fusca]